MKAQQNVASFDRSRRKTGLPYLFLLVLKGPEGPDLMSQEQGPMNPAESEVHQLAGFGIDGHLQIQ
jgi:hypothetical protein